MISVGVPVLHNSFWRKKSVHDLQRLYLGVTTTSAKIVEIIDSDPMDKNEERVLSYLQQYVWTW